MSGKDYEFTPAFEAAIQKHVDFCVQRIGSNKGDTRAMFERGQPLAGPLIGIFKKHDGSPLIGLYIPAVESAYVNLQCANEVGALVIFQFPPKTGEHFGLSKTDLLDVEKSADAAARYIKRSMKKFSGDPMKEALALLAYNRGMPGVERDLALLMTAENRGCSICVLIENSHRLDANFRTRVFTMCRGFLPPRSWARIRRPSICRRNHCRRFSQAEAGCGKGEPQLGDRALLFSGRNFVPRAWERVKHPLSPDYLARSSL